MKNNGKTDLVSRKQMILTGALGALLGFACAAALLLFVYLIPGREDAAPKYERIQRAVVTRTAPPAPATVEARKAPAPPPPDVAVEVLPAPKPEPPPPDAAVEVSPAPKPEQTPPEETRAELAQSTPEKQHEASEIGREPAGPWVVNAASLLSKPGAHRFQAKLKKDGWNAYISEITQRERLWHRVRIGFFQSRDEARQAAKKISKQYQLQGCMVLRRPTE